MKTIKKTQATAARPSQIVSIRAPALLWGSVVAGIYDYLDLLETDGIVLSDETHQARLEDAACMIAEALTTRRPKTNRKA